uniref:Lipid II isoglutaminyl synthase (glutamine-hydrolyzing) subunit MurT n=1 Tax=uncultured bacterium contig00006 TaxID=1181498 RepID=A0A806JYH6_9BACT|nr:putative amino acid ligase found clustered with an amidotransferase [uncultured bacterium contig00006]
MPRGGGEMKRGIVLFLAIIAGKLLCFALSLFGRGSSLPGRAALLLCPNILSKMRLPATIVAVTGSNGKTSTTELILRLAQSTGRTAISNSEGSNQTEGVVTLFLKHCSLLGRVRADIAVIESDERYCQYTFRQFAPHYIVVTNLFRDQLTRNGNNEFVCKELKKGLPAFSTLILNADDPLSASLGLNRDNVVYFAVDPIAFMESRGAPHAYDDGCRCPVCCGLMDYSYRTHNHLGAYACSFCGYARREPDHLLTNISGRSFVVDSLYDISPQMVNTMFANNIIAAFTAGTEAFGLTGEEIAQALSDYRLTNQRITEFRLGEHEGILMLSKHENSLSYNGALAATVNSRSKQKTAVIIFDQLSRKYIANDISWLWDIDFELLSDDRVKMVMLSGMFAHDLAARLAYAGIDQQKVRVQPDINAAVEYLRRNAVGELFVMTCFTDIGKFTSRLGEDEK